MKIQGIRDDGGDLVLLKYFCFNPRKVNDLGPSIHHVTMHEYECLGTYTIRILIDFQHNLFCFPFLCAGNTSDVPWTRCHPDHSQQKPMYNPSDGYNSTFVRWSQEELKSPVILASSRQSAAYGLIEICLTGQHIQCSSEDCNAFPLRMFTTDIESQNHFNQQNMCLVNRIEWVGNLTACVFICECTDKQCYRITLLLGTGLTAIGTQSSSQHEIEIDYIVQCGEKQQIY